MEKTWVLTEALKDLVQSVADARLAAKQPKATRDEQSRANKLEHKLRQIERLLE